jgi:mannose-6-phosphate isomerase-like protein (cupin superfamily)
MDIKKYLNSGILESYCLGMLSDEDEAYLIQMTILYPEIKAELTSIELFFENFAAVNSVEPHRALRQNILSAIGFTNSEELNINQLPAVSQSSDPQPWLDTLAHLIYPVPSEDFTLHVLRDDSELRQMLVISKIDVPAEDHDDFLESFFILEGRCECTIGDKLYALSPGDFIEIPLHAPHDIKIITPVVTAVLQYRFV